LFQNHMSIQGTFHDNRNLQVCSSTSTEYRRSVGREFLSYLHSQWWLEKLQSLTHVIGLFQRIMVESPCSKSNILFSLFRLSHDYVQLQCSLVVKVCEMAHFGEKQVHLERASKVVFSESFLSEVENCYR